MMNRHALLVLAAAASSLVAQSNVVPGLDGRLEILDNLTYWGRRGSAYPGGEVGLSMRNTMCNPGSVNIPWYAAMQENHPKFGFLIVRLAGDRMEQISDWSYCKHAFTSASTSGACGNCPSGIGGNQMGLQCSDTYSAGNNGDRYWLGPPSEIDPWLGVWTVTGSYFDRGDPDVGAPGNTDNGRSLTSPMVNAFDAVKNRVTIKESDLNQPGALYYYAIQLIHEGEAVANRGDNLKSRGFSANWSGSSWSVSNSGVGETFGSVLVQWPGATVDEGRNGNDDGRFFVGVKVTPLGGGNYHYEYAVHNVDNNRGGASFRVPIDASAVASNFTFGDIDSDPLNNWTAARVGNEVVFTAPSNNPQNWNTIYNFGFDANFAPGNSVCQIDEARVGPGALFVNVPTQAPSGATYATATPYGTGCGGTNCQTSFYEEFSPASAMDLANSSWTLTYSGGNYTLGTGTGSYIAPAGTTLTLGDDARASISLPFSLPYPGGSTTTLDVCSNGFVSAGNNGSAYTPSGSAFVGNAFATWSALWHDFNPSSTSAVSYTTSPTMAVISYTAIPNYSGGGTATFQYQFLPSGQVNVIYQAVTTAGNDYLAGFTIGGNAADPGSWDISANLAGGLSICTGPTPNMVLAASARPIIGTSINLVTSNIPANTLLGLQIYSPTILNPGVDLTFVGMPGCQLYSGLDSMITFPVAGSTGQDTLSVPNNPSLAGASIGTQAATLTVGANPFGFLTTNGVALTVGVN